MMKHTIIHEQVKSGFRRAGGWLLGMAWLFLVFFGLAEAFSRERPSPSLGYAALLLAGVVMFLTAEYWKKVFPSIMLAAILTSFLELLRAHAVNSPSVPVAPSTAAIHLLVTTAVTALTLTFKNRKLTALDRCALLAFVASILWGAVDKRFASLKLLVGACCILAAWLLTG